MTCFMLSVIFLDRVTSFQGFFVLTCFMLSVTFLDGVMTLQGVFVHRPLVGADAQLGAAAHLGSYALLGADAQPLLSADAQLGAEARDHWVVALSLLGIGQQLCEQARGGDQVWNLSMQYFIIDTVLAFRRKSSARPSGKKVTCRTVAGPEEDVRRVAPAAETQPRKRWRSWRMRRRRRRTEVGRTHTRLDIHG